MDNSRYHWNPSWDCSQIINLIKDCKPTIKNQRRLNPLMQEVIKKEIIKWLDAGVLYPILDCSWVSLIQCVPKKGGVTMVKNEKELLIST